MLNTIMTAEKSRIERIIDEINSKNAKKVALLLVIGFACYGIFHVRYGKIKFYFNWLVLNILFL